MDGDAEWTTEDTEEMYQHGYLATRRYKSVSHPMFHQCHL